MAANGKAHNVQQNNWISHRQPASFSAEVSITGVRQMCDAKTSGFRRFTWFLLLIGMTGFLGYQVGSRIIYYLGKPTIQTSEDVYYDKLPFPAVTICNRNNIRLQNTMVFINSSHGETIVPERRKLIYDFLSTLVTLLRNNNISEERINVLAEELNPGGKKMPLELFYRDGRHRREDMIKKCTFNGQPCQDDWFTPILTDAGMCYTFNGNDTHVLQTALYGKRGGLQLELNLEQYEYTKSTSDSAGVYLLIQDQKEVPNLVVNTALGVTAGCQTSIGLRMINRTSNWGSSCGSGTFTEYTGDQPYSRSACELVHLTRYVKDVCGCVDYYMLGYSENDDFRCGVQESVICVKAQGGIFPENTQSGSKYSPCKTPCHVKTYQATVSQMQISSVSSSLRVTKNVGNSKVFNDYKQGMMFRDWVLILEADSRLADDIHSLVYEMYTARSLVYLSLKELQEEINRLQQNTSVCLTDRSTPYEVWKMLQDIQLYQVVFSRKGKWTSWYQEDYPTPAVELSVDLAHDLLTDRDLNETLAAKLQDTCDAVTFDMEALLLYVNTFCNQTSVDSIHNTSSTNLSKKIEAVIRTAENASLALESLEPSYKKLKNNVTATIGSWYSAWNEKSLDPTFYKENYAAVEIFYQDMAVTEIKEYSVYTPIALLCDFGGCLGLCLGGSLLTLFEIVDIFFRKLFCCDHCGQV